MKRLGITRGKTEGGEYWQLLFHMVGKTVFNASRHIVFGRKGHGVAREEVGKGRDVLRQQTRSYTFHAVTTLACARPFASDRLSSVHDRKGIMLGLAIIVSHSFSNYLHTLRHTRKGRPETDVSKGRQTGSRCVQKEADRKPMCPTGGRPEAGMSERRQTGS